MKYVVMVSHGEFAPGLHSAVKMMTGDREDVLSTSLKDGMSADEFASNFAELVKDFKADDQVILSGRSSTVEIGDTEACLRI